MTQTVTDPFVSRLQRSDLVSEEQLAKGIAAVGEDESKLADYFVAEGILTRFQARQLKAGSTSLSVGNYIAVDFLGRGGNGIVLKAYHRLMPNRYVALKTLDTGNLHATPEVTARFRREIEIVSKLDHANIVRALDVIETRSHLYLVLEYVPGRDLGKVVQDRGPLSICEAVEYAMQVAEGLAYAHQSGIIHRDLKPTNLLLGKDRTVKISDMGLARFLDENTNSELTMKGLAIGTPDYMAPEQAEDATSVDPRCDLYSLGATLFYMLTGSPSVTGSSYLHKLQRLLTAPPRPLREVRPDVPVQLAELVDQLRARNPDDRPHSAQEAMRMLRPFGQVSDTIQVPAVNPKRVAELVMDVLQGKSRAPDVCQRFGLTESEFDRFMQKFIEGGRRAIESPSGSYPSSQMLQTLHAKIGAQQMEIEALKQRVTHHS